MPKFSKTRRKEVEEARKNRQEILRAGLTRREMMRMGLLTSAGLLIPKRGLSARARDSAGHFIDDIPCQSPSTPEFPLGWDLPTAMNGLMPIIQPFTSASDLTGPAPQVNPNTNINPATGLAYEGRTRAHQFATRFNPVKFYEVHQRRFLGTVHPALPPQPLWGFGRKTDPSNVAFSPGVTYVAHYGEPIMVRNYNDLPDDNEGFGLNQVSTHLHNGHTASESDGFPCDWFKKGQYYDQRYPNVLAGFDSTHSPNGDIRESLSTLWYHDHRVEFTAQNVYKGLAGFYLLFNEFDTGVEGQGFNLPAHPNYDIPLILTDRSFDEDSKLLCFDLGNFDGILGDRFLVNGRITPTFAVQPRRYRFRVLDGGPARFYQLFLTNLSALSADNKFWQISNDGNLLPRPVRVSSLKLGVAERADIIIDFSEYKGKTIYLENRLRQDDGRGPMNEEIRGAGQGNKLLKFVVSNTTVSDPSTDPATATFYQLPETSNTNPNIVPRVRRTFEFTRSSGSGWRINGKLMPSNCNENRFNVERNSIEEWTLVNSSGGWQHPIHIHMEEFQILSRSRGGAVPNALVENSRKDVVRLRDNETVKIFFRWRDWRERYPMHCHNTIHEDHAMMLRFSLADVGDTIQRP